MLQEAVEYHGVPRERIDIVGVPQYETYRQIGSITNESIFRNRLEIPNDTTIITYTGSSEPMFPDEERFVEELLLDDDAETASTPIPKALARSIVSL